MGNSKTENKDRGAFACVDSEHAYLQTGLTKREYFAGLAMQALATDKNLSSEGIATFSVKYADALLKELNK